MAHRRIRRVRRIDDLPPVYFALLTDQPLPEGYNVFSWIRYHSSDYPGRGMWHEREEILLLRHIVDRPGTRPSAWWRWTAPEPRRQVMGEGKFLDYGLRRCYFGIPMDWLSIDPYALPVFETQFEYLSRHNLFFPNELSRAKAPDRQGEVLPMCLWPRTAKGEGKQ